VVTLKCDQSLNSTRDNLVSFMGFTFDVVMSNCPAIMGPLDIKVMIQTDKGLLSIDDFLKDGGSLDNSTATANNASYYTPQGTLVTPTKTVPVASVTGLTMDKINQELDKVRADISNHNKVIFDYGPVRQRPETYQK
jgi:hypothetical protein